MQVGSFPERKLRNISSSEDNESTVELLKNAVLRGLGHFAPNSTVEILIGILEQEHSVDFETLPDNVKILREGLTKMFGGVEAVIERKICQALAKKLGVDGDGKSLEDLVSVLNSDLFKKRYC